MNDYEIIPSALYIISDFQFLWFAFMEINAPHWGILCLSSAVWHSSLCVWLQSATLTWFACTVTDMWQLFSWCVYRVRVQESDFSLDELSDCSSGSIEVCCDDLTTGKTHTYTHTCTLWYAIKQIFLNFFRRNTHCFSFSLSEFLEKTYSSFVCPLSIRVQRGQWLC